MFLILHKSKSDIKYSMPCPYNAHLRPQPSMLNFLYSFILLIYMTLHFLYQYIYTSSIYLSWITYTQDTHNSTDLWKTMKVSSHFFKFSSSSSSVTLGSVQRRTCFLKQMVCKLKGRWKQSLGWQRRSPSFSYDHQSYCLNFDDGISDYIN